ncbi:PAC2 family protein [Nanoarchaeota archaeon]
MTWKITKIAKNIPPLNNPVLIEGLPGIGNVGKIAVDFIVDELKAKKCHDFFSSTFPHSVFVNERNLVELPKIELYYKSFNDKKKQDLLLLSGDVQPMDEVASYEFCDAFLSLAVELGCREIITIGGIGLPDVPEKPSVHCTGSSKKIIDSYIKNTKALKNLHTLVGPIVGVSGLLVGLSKKYKMEGVCFLAETYGHPLFLGIKGSQEVLKILDKKFKLKLNLTELEKEILDIEEDLKKSQDLSEISKSSKTKKYRGMTKNMSYIG